MWPMSWYLIDGAWISSSVSSQRQTEFLLLHSFSSCSVLSAGTRCAPAQILIPTLRFYSSGSGLLVTNNGVHFCGVFSYVLTFDKYERSLQSNCSLIAHAGQILFGSGLPLSNCSNPRARAQVACAIVRFTIVATNFAKRAL